MDWIQDKTRVRRKPPIWSNMYDILFSAACQYRSDWHADQPNYVEVWVEKRGLEEIFYRITREYGVYVCPGGESKAHQL